MVVTCRRQTPEEEQAFFLALDLLVADWVRRELGRGRKQ
jgi:hypothetical protein